MNTMLDAAFTGTKPRLIFLSPIAHEDLGRPLPDPSKHNRELGLYRDAIKKVAAERSAWFVDLDEPTVSAQVYGIGPLTDNGINLTHYGYWYLDSILDSELRCIKSSNNAFSTTRAGGRASLAKVRTSSLYPIAIQFELTDTTLPAPGLPIGAPADASDPGHPSHGETRDLPGGVTP